MKRIGFNDDWTYKSNQCESQNISIPHDALQELGRAAGEKSGKGGAYYKTGILEYSKTFEVPDEWEKNEIILELEGVYPHAEIYLNNNKIGQCVYGFAGYRFPLKDLAYGKDNELKVRVDASQTPDCRWYAGAGIYRPVWLWLGAKNHIAPNGVKVTTISTSPAKILVETKCVQHAGHVKVEIIFNGCIVATGAGSKCEIDIPDARLWDVENPNIYQCDVAIVENGATVDTATTNFGVRDLSWSTDGFFVNGEKTLLKGGCIHSDNGILGARVFAESEWRKIKKLKEFGFNAVRIAHNPACESLLEACDSLGMYVMDEAWDMWYKSKSKFDYAERFEANYQNDIIYMVDKDYNHPSVIMYSVGNEVTEPFEPKGLELGKELVRLFHEADSTRPVTCGINLTLLYMASMGIDMTGASNSEETSTNSNIDEKTKTLLAREPMSSEVFNEMISTMGMKMNMAAATDAADAVTAPILDAFDIAGYNYASSRYPIEGEKHPERIVVGTETYAQEIATNWKMVEQYPYLIGDFMWTAWDYLGEVGIGAWTWEKDGANFHKEYPWLLADTGAFDILGNDNAEAGQAAVVWGKRKTPYIGIMPVNHNGEIPAQAIWRGTNAIPYWSYQGCAGYPAQVEVYGSGVTAELFINGNSVGKKDLENAKATFHTKYEPGTIKAVVSDEDGNLVESSLESADGETRISVVSERQSVITNIVYVDINLTGENGEIECNRDTTLTVKVDGGELLAFGSANPRTAESFVSGTYTTYYGRSLAVVKKLCDEVIVTVNGNGLETVKSSL